MHNSNALLLRSPKNSNHKAAKSACVLLAYFFEKSLTKFRKMNCDGSTSDSNGSGCSNDVMNCASCDVNCCDVNGCVRWVAYILYSPNLNAYLSGL